MYARARRSLSSGSWRRFFVSREGQAELLERARDKLGRLFGGDPLNARIPHGSSPVHFQKLRANNARLKEAHATLKNRLDVLKDRNALLKSRVERSRDSINVLRERIANLKELLSIARQKHKEKSALWAVARKSHFVVRQINFANAAKAFEAELAADVYVSLLPNCLPAAFGLQADHGGMVVCDNVENVEVDRHTAAPKHDRKVVRLANHAAYGALMDADKLLTVGDKLAETLERFGRPVMVMENYRNFEPVTADFSVRREMGIPDDVFVLFTCGSIIHGMEYVLEALATLPAHFHLLGLIRFVSADDEARIMAQIDELGLTSRVHFRSFVPYDQLASVAAAANVGLITNDISNPNASVGFPNRLFDFLAGELPVVATAMPDVKRTIEALDFGRVVDARSADSWKKALSDVDANYASLKANATVAKKKLSWESKEDALYDYLGCPSSATFISYRDLTKYQRFIRMAKTLQKKGCDVRFFFFAHEPDEQNLVPGVRYFCVSSTYEDEDCVRELVAPAPALAEDEGVEYVLER